MDLHTKDGGLIDDKSITNKTTKDVILTIDKKHSIPFVLNVDSPTPTSTTEISIQYAILRDLCQNNADFYVSDDSKTGIHLHTSFTVLVDQIDVAVPLIETLLKNASAFDFDERTPANGYRSYVTVVNACVRRAIVVCQEVKEKRASFFFRKHRYSGKVDRYRHLLTSLTVCLHQLILLLSLSKDGDLFSNESHSVEFLQLADSLNTLPFYGPSIGFQFCESLRIILRNISIGMASYSKIYESQRCKFTKGAIGAWSGFRYSYNPEKRAEKLAAISKFASLEFCKSFWFLAESDAAYRMSNKVGRSIRVNKVIMIEPEPLVGTTVDGNEIEIPVASSHFPPSPIPGHLFSATKRKGMSAGASAPLSRDLIIHCHGGGFVAQSPRSHEIYLRDWAHQLDVPIFSIDYSLAPKAPFPRPLEEALYAYCWALKNCHLLGSTAERIVFAGDSAGANLCMALALKCIDLNLPLPTGIFVAYFPVLISSAPSPSRLLTFMDPILPYGFLLGCLRAYACPSQTTSDTLVEKPVKGQQQNKVSPIETTGVPHSLDKKPLENKSNTNYNNNIAVALPKTFLVHRDLKLEVPQDPFLSPWWASDEVLRQLPPVSILTLELDPCLDDCVMFARRLKRLGNSITLDVEQGLPHGFLYFALLCEEAHAASDLCVQRIKQLFEVK